MGGFQFSLKNSRVSKSNNSKKKQLLLLKKVSPKQSANQNALGGDEEDDEPKKTSIDAFDSKDGALNGSDAISREKDLVIVPANLSTGILKKERCSELEAPDQERESKKAPSADDIARASLLKGETVGESGHLTLDLSQDSKEVEENTEKDYEEVPVDQFGAALLRGMGWDGKVSKKEQTDVSHRQRGIVLGIGSKLVGKELEQELMMKRGTKLSVPLIRKEYSK